MQGLAMSVSLRGNLLHDRLSDSKEELAPPTVGPERLYVEVLLETKHLTAFDYIRESDSHLFRKPELGTSSSSRMQSLPPLTSSIIRTVASTEFECMWVWVCVCVYVC